MAHGERKEQEVDGRMDGTTRAHVLLYDEHAREGEGRRGIGREGGRDGTSKIASQPACQSNVPPSLRSSVRVRRRTAGLRLEENAMQKTHRDEL